MVTVPKKIVKQQINALGAFDSWFAKKEIAQHLPEVLSEGENILFMTSGTYDRDTWLITATDTRLIFLDKGMLFGFKQHELPYEKISSISYSLGLTLASVSIETSYGDVRIDNLQKAEAPKLTELVSNYIRNLKAKTVYKSTSTAGNDIVSQLERLAALKEKGVLTDREFAEQKAKILASNSRKES